MTYEYCECIFSVSPCYSDTLSGKTLLENTFVKLETIDFSHLPNPPRVHVFSFSKNSSSLFFSS